MIKSFSRSHVAKGLDVMRRLYAQSSIERDREHLGLTGTGNLYLGSAIACAITGYDAEAAWLLRAAYDRLVLATTTNEIPRHYFAGASEAQRHSNLGLCQWILEDSSPRETFRRAMTEEGRYIDRNLDALPDELEFQLTLCILAEERDRGLAYFEMVSPKKRGASASVLASLCDKNADRMTAKERAQQFFKRSLPGWLNSGLYTNAARWIKLLYWDQSQRTHSAKTELREACADLVVD